jgi:hypothetical protein
MSRIKDWTKVDEEGNINVPDYLDPLIHKFEIQMRSYKHKGKNEVQTICDMVYLAEEFFNEKRINNSK